MALILEGVVTDVETKTVEAQSGNFDKTIVYVLNGRHVERVELARELNESTKPKANDRVRFEVGIRAYKLRDGGVGYGLTAYRQALAVAPATGARAAS